MGASLLDSVKEQNYVGLSFVLRTKLMPAKKKTAPNPPAKIIVLIKLDPPFIKTTPA